MEDEVNTTDGSVLEADQQILMNEITRDLIILCINTENHKILFKALPKVMNNLFSLQTLILTLTAKIEKYGNRSSESKRLIEQAGNLNSQMKAFGELLLKLNENKIPLILPQLLQVYTLENDTLINFSVELLARLVTINPHQNAYWLASLLISEDEITIKQRQQEDKLAYDDNRKNMKTLNIKRVTFGTKIFSKLSKDTKILINNYKDFQTRLKNLSEKVKRWDSNEITSDQSAEVKRAINEINSLIKNGGKFIVPNLQNMRQGYLIHEGFGRTQKEGQMQSLLLDLDEHNNNFVNDIEHDFISEVSDKFSIMESKEVPMKITFSSQTNKKFHFLLKGEVRDAIKELQAGEVFHIVNQIFTIEGLKKSYGMHLKQYNLVPISANIIIIEWLENAFPLKNAIEPEWERNGVQHGFEFYNFRLANVPDFYKKCGPEGSVLYQYFLDNYNDPNQWYDAKMKFIVSCAIWSMTGVLLGLGDRHNQNIMLDLKGEMIHIDFGVILNSGKRLKVPEIVDFRFTKNIRRALGLFEGQGPFSYICCVTLKAFVKHFDSLLTRLNFFINDPLVKKDEK
jgi:hypothetical protein